MEFEEQLAGRVETADTIMMYHCMSLSRKTIERLEKCQLIVRCGVGFDNVDWQFAASLGIPVANVPDYGTEEVADSAIGLTLALTRGFHLLNSQLRHTPEPWSYKIAAPVRRLRGAVFGVVDWVALELRARNGPKRLAWTWFFTIHTSQTATTRLCRSAAWTPWKNCSHRLTR